MSADLEPARDALFRDPERTGPFAFDAEVARVLPDMLGRSIPGYAVLRDLITVLVSQMPEERLHAYDLGCSLGAVTSAILAGAGERPVQVVAVDSSPAMIDRFREQLGTAEKRVVLACQDVLDTAIERAQLVVLNFTLQFVAPEHRDALVTKIARGLEPGGTLILSEKTRPEADHEALFDALHDEFRRQRGYSDLEIARKRKALERVLVPEPTSAHANRLERAGLRPVEWFRGLGFVSWLAFKPS